MALKHFFQLKAMVRSSFKEGAGDLAEQES